MYLALVLVVLLIDATPALLIMGESFAPGIATAAVAVAGLIVACTLRRSDRDDLQKFFPSLAIAASVPVAWMLIQILPLANVRWAHPVWQSAAAALDGRIVGSISVDRGLTLLVLCKYVSAVAIMLVVAAVAVDRHRAKWILVALTGAATIIGLVVAVQAITGVKLFNDGSEGFSHQSAMDSIALGAVLCATAIVRAVDGYEKPRGRLDAALAPSVAAFTICVATLVWVASSFALFGLVFGLATLLSVIAIRRFRLNSWGIAAISSMMVLAAFCVVATQPGIYTSDPTLALASVTPSEVSVTERMLADGTWTGSGAGSFQALAPIYKDPDNLFRQTAAPTLAAAIALELGRPALWAIIAIALGGIAILLRGGLNRRRSFFYPAGGASCLLTATVLGFSSVGLSSTPAMIILASSLGLGFAQSKTRAGFLSE